MSMKAKLGHSAESEQSRFILALSSKLPVKKDPFSRLPAMRKRAADSRSK